MIFHSLFILIWRCVANIQLLAEGRITEDLVTSISMGENLRLTHWDSSKWRKQIGGKNS